MSKHKKVKLTVSPDAVLITELQLVSSTQQVLESLGVKTVDDLIHLPNNNLRMGFTDYYLSHKDALEAHEWEEKWTHMLKTLNKICKPFMDKAERAFNPISWSTENADHGVYKGKAMQDPKKDKSKRPTGWNNTHDLIGALGLSDRALQIISVKDIESVAGLINATADDHLYMYSSYYVNNKYKHSFRNIDFGKYWNKYMEEVNKKLRPYCDGNELDIPEWSPGLAERLISDKFDDEPKRSKKKAKLLGDFGFEDITTLVLREHWRNNEHNHGFMPAFKVAEMTDQDLWEAYNRLSIEYSPMPLRMDYEAVVEDLNNKFKDRAEPFNIITEEDGPAQLTKETLVSDTGIDENVQPILSYWWDVVQGNKDPMTIGDLLCLGVNDIVGMYQQYKEKFETERNIVHRNTFIFELNESIGKHFNMTWPTPKADYEPKGKPVIEHDESLNSMEKVREAILHLAHMDKAFDYMNKHRLSVEAAKAMIDEREQLVENDPVYATASKLMLAYKMVLDQK